MGNVASEGGHTQKHYLELQKLHEKYNADGLEILAFPCNQFGGQEPASLPEILKNTAADYGRTFPLQDKIDVKGPQAIPLYKEMLNTESVITWNFHKFLINRKGELYGSYKPKISPFAMEDDIVSLLKAQ